MPIELAAAAVASFLVPIVTKGVEALVAKVGDRAGDAAATELPHKVSRAWAKLKAKLGGPGDKALLEEIAKDPDNEPITRVLEKRVQEELERDVDLRTDLTDIVAALTARPTTDFAMSHSGSGDQNVVYAPNSDFRGSQGTTIGARVEQRPAPPPADRG